MKLQNVHGLGSIDEYVKYKLALYKDKEKNFESLFEMMFDEKDNVMVETTDGYRVNKVTYGAFKEQILATVPSVAAALGDLPAGTTVGLYMANRPEWLTAFWCILAAGYRPLLMNTRLPDDISGLRGLTTLNVADCPFSSAEVERVRKALGDNVVILF